MARIIEEMKKTVNRSVFNRAYRRYLSHEANLCDRCPFHRAENARHKPQKSWKKKRRTRWVGGATK